ncbi:hypothetical protein HF313_03945 [Massilia atriviolacea]|uniref:Uncharacterized protein n=1 Tax=Massilia atriviolacea TaxID=2495579 RepID=A0A430HE18_9BURK|nr:hypothetical protein [Massilia atriviolacea]RSZ55784.1 hypothetical protein EJB06_27480 [Massilia atriviolacea]
MIAAGLIFLIGIGSAAVYLWRRQWIDAALILVAAAALGVIVGDFRLPAGVGGTLSIDSEAEAIDLNEAAAVKLTGDGLPAAQWHDLPARPLLWETPASEVLHLDFPRELTLGRMFALTVRRSQAASWRLQLLAENRQVIADVAGEGAALTVQWLPPVAETLVLSARMLDASGKVMAHGPVPFSVTAPVPLQVVGRFGAPSFDARALNELLVNSHAALDWQVVLGKTVTRSETARAAPTQPNLLVADAAHIERLGDGARAALLAQVAAGTPLVILAANAQDKQTWARTVQLPLKEQAEARPAGTPLALASAPLNPAAVAGPWSAAGDRIWTRSWEKGRIVWLGVADWHRYAISEPQALALWWQGVLDRAGIERAQDVAWLDPQEMPLPGRRVEVCALGVQGKVTFPELKQTLAWQRRPDKADASCVAVWPRKAGWLAMQTDGAKPVAGKLYVYDRADWPLWQKAQRRAATARYAARTPAAMAAGTAPLPAWPFALLFALAMLLLWWRERR